MHRSSRAYRDVDDVRVYLRIFRAVWQPILNVIVGVALSMAAGFVFLKGVQYAAFDGQSAWFLSITLLGFSSIMGA